jgi:hypothetical protein
MTWPILCGAGDIDTADGPQLHRRHKSFEDESPSTYRIDNKSARRSLGPLNANNAENTWNRQRGDIEKLNRILVLGEIASQ